MNDALALTEPAPFVERTHAWPRSFQTLFICGMFGMGTPPLLARPNCARTGSEKPAPAFRFAGQRPATFASAVCAAAVDMKFVTKSCASDSTPCAAAYFVTMKPWTPRNGTDGYTIFGSWTIVNLRPLFFSVSEFHGPVIQN